MKVRVSSKSSNFVANLYRDEKTCVSSECTDDEITLLSFYWICCDLEQLVNVPISVRTNILLSLIYAELALKVSFGLTGHAAESNELTQCDKTIEDASSRSSMACLVLRRGHGELLLNGSSANLLISQMMRRTLSPSFTFWRQNQSKYPLTLI